MKRLDYRATSGRAEILLLMLPAAGCDAADFAAHGLVAAAQDGSPVDVIAVQLAAGAYLAGGVAAALHAQIVGPALAQGYRRLWLLGISLGGMGALLYAASRPAGLEGIVLLAPFIGTKGTVAGLVKAGGLMTPGDPGIATEGEREVLDWLRGRLATPAAGPALHLGYGAQDRFAPGHRMLAEALPPDRVTTLPGGHDWACWSALWREMLARRIRRDWTDRACGLF